MMLRQRAVGLLVFVALGLTGCGTLPPPEPAVEAQGRFDQTDAQRRARIRLQLAVGYYEQRQYDVALNEIRQAIAADPTMADAYSLRGLLNMEMGENRAAEESFRQALRLSPNNPDFNNNYGWFLCQNGRPADARGYFEAALKNRSYQSPEKALNNAGLCSLQMKDRAAAEQYFAQAFRYDPANPITNLNLGKIYFAQRDFERARFHVKRVIGADVVSPEALWLGVRIERRLGDKEAENSMATLLRRRFPRSPEFAAYERGAFDE